MKKSAFVLLAICDSLLLSGTLNGIPPVKEATIPMPVFKPVVMGTKASFG